MQARQVLIIGARKNSLGDFVRVHGHLHEFDIVTAGIDNEDVYYDVTWSQDKHDTFFEELAEEVGVVDHVVYTAGINDVDPSISIYRLVENMEHAMAVNVIGMVKCYNAWRLGALTDDGRPVQEDSCFGNTNLRLFHHFVAISSNSAHIARRGSLAYCSSKAALSMAVRVLGREAAGRETGGEVIVYAYEPGWLEGTPMSAEVAHELRPDQYPYHRIPGGEAIQPGDLADMIIRNLKWRNRMLNGTCVRLDGGEQ